MADRGWGRAVVVADRVAEGRAFRAVGVVGLGTEKSTEKSGNIYRVGYFLDFVWRSGTARTEVRAHMGVHRTCGEPGEIELAAIGRHGRGYIEAWPSCRLVLGPMVAVMRGSTGWN